LHYGYLFVWKYVEIYQSGKYEKKISCLFIKEKKITKKSKNQFYSG